MKQNFSQDIIITSGKFYAKFSLGDAPFDTALRVQQAINKVMDEYRDRKVKNVFIFTHGITLRTFVMRFCNYTVNWYEKQENPENCAIYHITYRKNKIIDHGFIHDKDYEKKLTPKKKSLFKRIFKK